MSQQAAESLHGLRAFRLQACIPCLNLLPLLLELIDLLRDVCVLLRSLRQLTLQFETPVDAITDPQVLVQQAVMWRYPSPVCKQIWRKIQSDTVDNQPYSAAVCNCTPSMRANSPHGGSCKEMS